MFIIDIAEQEVKKHKANSVEKIELDIGELSGIEKNAFEFAWEHGINNSVLAGAKKEVNYIKGRAQCLECGAEFDIENLFDECPECNSYFKDLRRGKELHVKSLTLI